MKLSKADQIHEWAFNLIINDKSKVEDLACHIQEQFPEWSNEDCDESAYQAVDCAAEAHDQEQASRDYERHYS